MGYPTVQVYSSTSQFRGMGYEESTYLWKIHDKTNTHVNHGLNKFIVKSIKESGNNQGDAGK